MADKRLWARPAVLVASLLLSAISSRPAFGQRVATVTEDGRREVQRVSVDIKDAPLVTVLSAIAQQAGLIPVYDASQLPRDTRVTLHVRNVLVDDAFEQALRGTGLVAQFRAKGQVVIVPSAMVAQAVGTIVGVVTSAKTQEPISAASVLLDDSVRRVLTDRAGRYRMANVSVGAHRVTVRMIGFARHTQPVTVTDGGTVTVNVTLNGSVNTLEDVVTTATGDVRRYEVGHTVGTIQADSIVATTLIRNMSDLLQARVPGVVVQNTSGDVGAPSKIRLRGVNSLALNNDPIVVLDGVRLNAQTTVANLQTNVGAAAMLGQLTNPIVGGSKPLAPSRLDDIDPNTIESIDVLRGPEASSLYGTDAANGVIIIKTKRGRVGAWRTTLVGDIGQSAIPGTMPDNWFGWGYGLGAYSVSCFLAAGSAITVAGGGCTQDSVTHFNSENFGPMRTLGTGTNSSLSASLSGGNESVQQFFSGRVASSVGMAQMSEVEQHLIARLWSVPAPSWMRHPNTEQDINGSSRTTFALSRQADVSLNTTGIYRTVLNGGNGVLGLLNGRIYSPADSLFILPSESQRTRVTSTEKRGTAAVDATYRPASWLSLNGTGGGDYGLRADQSDLQAQYCTTAIPLVLGGSTVCPSGHQIARGETFVTTVNGGAILSFAPSSWLTLRTALGEQYSHTSFYNLQVGNSDPYNCPLQFGTTLLTPVPVCSNGSLQQYAVTENRDEAATAGVYVEETIGAFGLYTTFGFLQSVASGFGGQVTKSPPNYPKFNLSYPLSEQSFFPKQSIVSSVRLRLAYGQSGNQASQIAVRNNYGQSSAVFGGSTAATQFINVSALGNATLRPEKSTSWEGGADVSFLENERIHAEVTLYRKFTRDMLASLQLPPSLGPYSQYYNLGNVMNRGVEVGLTAKIAETRAFAWYLTVNASKNTNKLVHQAPTLNVNGPLNTQFREGYPLYGYWGVPVVSYTDANGDEILAQNEIIFGSRTYFGAPYPKGEVTYGNSVLLMGGALRLAATLDQVIGQTTQLVAGTVFVPRAAVDRTASLAQQAAYIQAVVNNNAYLETSSTVRLNELSATYNLPASVARRMHATSLAVTVAGRNVALWSSYVGKDPDVDTSGLLGEASQDNSLGTPQPRSWTLRFNLGL